MTKAFNAADMDTALDAVKATYERLVNDGIDPNHVVIAMSEIIAYCLAHKSATGCGDESYRLWLRAFESSYRAQLAEYQP